MSCIMRRKHVLKEMMQDDFALPTQKQQIVRLATCRGNNLHEVEAAASDEKNFLVSMPNKFRRNIFVKRGDFVLVEAIEEGSKVKAEIVKILTSEHVKEFTKTGVWPKRFMRRSEPVLEEKDDEDCDEFMVRNRNRPLTAWPKCVEEDTDSDEESEEESDEETDEEESDEESDESDEETDESDEKSDNDESY